MGNSFGCSASGERLVSAARDGDLVEARMLLEFNPCLARYATFGGLNSPLHFAAAKGHNEIVSLLLLHGAEVNSRNYCGQTALMHACRYGHWEVVQTLLLYKCNVTRADYLSGRTALHFAALNGHVRCMRLVVADFVPSEPYELITSSECSDESSIKQKFDRNSLSRFVNKAADGGITALHVAALNGYFDCVQLLLDLNASVSAVTFHYGTSMDLIGAGSTPLHYAACGGSMKSCQALIAKGARRSTLNSNGWLPFDVARLWSRHWLEPLLAPNSDLIPPTFPPSKYLALPLLSILNIAREHGLQSDSASSDDSDFCSVCLERPCTVAAKGCAHEFCVKCALYLCSTVSVTSEAVTPPGSIRCPLCRNGIMSFIKLPCSPVKDLNLDSSLVLCTSCMLQTHGCAAPSTSLCRADFRKIRVASGSSDIFCTVSCAPFPSVTMPSCAGNEASYISRESPSEGTRDEALQMQQNAPPTEQGTTEGTIIEKTTGCSMLFRHRRSFQREQQCTSEINA